MHKKSLLLIAVSLSLIMALPVAAYAHVIVTPAQVGVAQELTFNISVPNEQQTPVVSLKLLIPTGVTDVMPTEKDGWAIQATTTGSANPVINAITWSGGTIPVGQRADFSFSAQVPGSATTLDWKAYQTYGDGTVVHWDQTPAGSDDASGNAGPYSVTHVINDLAAKPAPGASKAVYGAYVLAGLAFGVAILTFFKKR